MTDIRSRSAGPENTAGAVASTASQEGSAVAHHAKDAVADVASTAKEQTQQVAQEAVHQTRQIVGDARQRIVREADEQARRVSQGIAKLADELSSMVEHSAEGSPAAGALRQVADTGRQAARFLDERGAGGVLDSAQDFARRKPGTFLLGAAVAGFLVGRVVKSANGSSDSGRDTGRTGRPETAQPAQAETWRTAQPAGAQPAAVPYDPSLPPSALVFEPTGGVVPPAVDPPSTRTTQHVTPGGGMPRVQP